MKNQAQHTMYRTVDRSPLPGPYPVKRTCGGGLRAWVLLLAGLLVIAGARVATAKSLYVIAEVEYATMQIRVHAYDISPEGKLTLQKQGYVPLYGAEALGLALDSDSRHLFLTCLTSNVITNNGNKPGAPRAALEVAAGANPAFVANAFADNHRTIAWEKSPGREAEVLKSNLVVVPPRRPRSAAPPKEYD